MLTIPNALTFLRFLGIPLFLHLALNLEADGWAISVLAIGGATDYFDGKLARAWGQTSRFGEIADPRQRPVDTGARDFEMVFA